ncbi:MAG: CvpA family protein [Pseudomonadota bacterium]
MDGFTIIDGVVAGIIVLSAILAYSRGLVREAMAVLGWVGAAVLAFTFAGAFEPLVREIPVVGDFLGDSCELAVLAAFSLVFAVSLVVISFFTPLLSSAIRDSAVGGIDRGLGFLFGVARGVLLVAVAFVVYDRWTSNDGVPVVEQSRSAIIFARAQANIEQQIPEDAPSWIVTRYEALVGECGAPVETQTDA